MNIIINHSSMVPIYEQIVDAVKTQIRKGELKEDENLPSVRMLAKDIKISALTVIEADLEKAVLKARRCGISDEELKNLLELILEG